MGLHFKILIIVKYDPLKMPNFFNALIEYSEHDGKYLQLLGKKGEIIYWYIFTK